MLLLAARRKAVPSVDGFFMPGCHDFLLDKGPFFL